MVPARNAHRFMPSRFLPMALSFVVFIAVIAGVPIGAPSADAALAEACYIFADGGDRLSLVNRATDAITHAPNQAGVSNIEAIALNPSFTVLYAADAYRLGTLNTTTGVYTNIGSFEFADDGTAAEIEILDVDALAFDQSGVLWGVDPRSGNDATHPDQPGEWFGGGECVLGRPGLHLHHRRLHPDR